MGWWSKDIMGGDAPLDWEGLFLNICGIDFDEEDMSRKEIASALESNLEKFREAIKEDEYDGGIGPQVIAIMFMRSGASIDNIRPWLLEEIAKDEWAQEDSERKQKIDDLMEAVRNYKTGHPVVINSKGLFQAIAEHLNNGKKGLVNVDSPIG